MSERREHVTDRVVRALPFPSKSAVVADIGAGSGMDTFLAARHVFRDAVQRRSQPLHEGGKIRRVQ